MELFDKMLQREKEDFRRISNRLLSTCFLCRANETSKSDYYFVLKYKNEFKTYLDVLGYRLEVNEELGVIQLVNAYNYNRMNLKLYESIILLILRILYDEKKRELSISDEVIVNLGDIQDKYLSLQIRDKMIDKTTMRNALSVFRRRCFPEKTGRGRRRFWMRSSLWCSVLPVLLIRRPMKTGSGS